MKKVFLLLILYLCGAFTTLGQSTTTSGQITDAGAQSWNGGTVSFQLVANPSFPNLQSYTWTGGTLPQVITGSLSGSGAYSVSIPSNSAISPVGSKWLLTVCPAATSPCFNSANTTITGATQTLNLTPPVIAINLGKPDQFINAYSDAEIVTAFVGGQYYNLTTQLMRDCQTVVGTACTVWANVGGAGGGVAFSAITSGTNTTAAMVCGTGCSISTSGTGTIAGTPGGANTNIQYNDSTAFGGDANLTWNKTTRSLEVNQTFGTTPATSEINLTAGLAGESQVLANNAGIAIQTFTVAPIGISSAGSLTLIGTAETFTAGTITFQPGTGAAVTIGKTSGTLNNGAITLLGSTSGSATIQVGGIAGTPAPINLPIATGVKGSFLQTDGGTPQLTSWFNPLALVTGSDYTNATTTFSNVTGLSFPVAANTNYTMHCSVVWSTGTATGGPQFQITGPAAPTSVAINMISAITSATTASAATTSFSSAMNPVGTIVTTGANEMAHIDMGLVNGANAGTIQLQAAAQGVGTLTIRQASSCTLQ